jgi:ribulose-phosphate 3-epimerase
MEQLKSIGIDGVHYDVMDGNFVPNISFGPKILKEISSAHKDIFYDVHLMINEPDMFLEEFIKSGASSIT